jgi:hypothetical protein
MPQFLSVVNCIGIDLSFKYPHRRKAVEFKSCECAGQELELHVYNPSSIQDNYQTAVDWLNDCNMVKHNHVETTCEDAY